MSACSYIIVLRMCLQRGERRQLLRSSRHPNTFHFALLWPECLLFSSVPGGSYTHIPFHTPQYVFSQTYPGTPAQLHEGHQNRTETNTMADQKSPVNHSFCFLIYNLYSLLQLSLRNIDLILTLLSSKPSVVSPCVRKKI